MYDMVSGWCFNGYTWLCNVDVALATSGCVNSVLRQMICCSSSSNNVSIFLIRGDKGCHMPYKGCHMPYKGCHIPYKGCHYHPPSCLCLYFRVRARQSFRSWPSLPCSQTAPLWCLGGIPPPPSVVGGAWECVCICICKWWVWLHCAKPLDTSTHHRAP